MDGLWAVLGECKRQRLRFGIRLTNCVAGHGAWDMGVRIEIVIGTLDISTMIWMKSVCAEKIILLVLHIDRYVKVCS